MDFLWDAVQQRQIQNTQTDILNVKEKVIQNRDQTYDLTKKIDRLTLATQAMWELMRDRFGIEESELINKVVEIDLRDGRKDGKITSQARCCPSCKRPMSSKSSTCAFCNYTTSKKHAFE